MTGARLRTPTSAAALSLVVSPLVISNLTIVPLHLRLSQAYIRRMYSSYNYSTSIAPEIRLCKLLRRC